MLLPLVGGLVSFLGFLLINLITGLALMTFNINLPALLTALFGGTGS